MATGKEQGLGGANSAPASSIILVGMLEELLQHATEEWTGAAPTTVTITAS
jgi:hypothetical protein